MKNKLSLGWMPKSIQPQPKLFFLQKRECILTRYEIPYSWKYWAVKACLQTSYDYPFNMLMQESQKQPPNLRKHLRWSLFQIKRDYIKNRLQHRCFPLNVAKFLRTPMLKSICERLLLKSIINSKEVIWELTWNWKITHQIEKWFTKMTQIWVMLLPGKTLSDDSRPNDVQFMHESSKPAELRRESLKTVFCGAIELFVVLCKETFLQEIIWNLVVFLRLISIAKGSITGQKMKFFNKDFFSKCDQNYSFPWNADVDLELVRIWSHLLKKFLMENFIFCAVNNMDRVNYEKSLSKPLIYVLTLRNPENSLGELSQLCRY